MEVVRYAFKAEQFPGDRSELRGTELGHAGVYVDALAYFSDNMSLPTAFVEGGRAMIYAHRDLSRVSKAREQSEISAAELAQAEEAQVFSQLQFHVWADNALAMKMHDSAFSIHPVVREYQVHVRALSIAIQRLFSHIEPAAERVLTKEMEVAVNTIIHNLPFSANESILSTRDVSYQHIQQLAALQVRIWQIRTWEESVLYSITRALSEERGLPWKRSDGVFLRVPLHALIPARREMNYRTYEFLTDPQSESVIQYIQRHDSLFSRRNFAPRRALKRFQYAMRQG